MIGEVVIPLCPDRALSPNSRKHWRAKYQASSFAKEVAFVYTLEEFGPLKYLTGAVLHFTVRWGKGRKRMDDDNLIASLKYYRDGIAQALGTDDKNFVTGTVTQERDPAGVGEVIVRLEAA